MTKREKYGFMTFIIIQEILVKSNTHIFDIYIQKKNTQICTRFIYQLANTSILVLGLVFIDMLQTSSNFYLQII